MASYLMPVIDKGFDHVRVCAGNFPHNKKGGLHVAGSQKQQISFDHIRYFGPECVPSMDL